MPRRYPKKGNDEAWKGQLSRFLGQYMERIKASGALKANRFWVVYEKIQIPLGDILQKMQFL